VPLTRLQFDNFEQVVTLLTKAVISADSSLPPFEALFRGMVNDDLTDAINGNLHPAPFTRLADFGHNNGFSDDDVQTIVAALNRMLPPYPMLTLLLIDADQWDGYSAERKALMQFLQASSVANVVSLSGNVNAFMAGTVMDDYDTPKVPVMVDLTTAGISAPSLFRDYEEYLNTTVQTQPWLSALLSSGALAPFGDLLKTNNAWLRYVDADAQGYALVTLTPTQLSCTFKKVAPLTNGEPPTGTGIVAATQVVTVDAGTNTISVG
jgi:alkaline phosphatase D